MESNEGAIDADANIDAQARAKARRRNAHLPNPVQHAPLQTTPLLQDPDEQSPLLSDALAPPYTEDDDEQGVPKWPGLKDFEGLPWYKQPSVSR